MKYQKLGFTLIELLIVIAIIGVLVGGIMVGLDPIEQIRRGRDSSRAAMLKEFINACERFYAMNETPATSCTAPAPGLNEELKNCTRIIGEINAVWSADCRTSTFNRQSSHYLRICGDLTCTIDELEGLL